MSEFSNRFERVRTQLELQGVDAVLLSVGADLPYLTGYSPMATERLTMLVIPKEGDAKMVIPTLESSLVQQHDDFDLVQWGETEDPLAIVQGLLGNAGTVAVGDTMWAKFLVGLLNGGTTRSFRNASEIMTPLRARKTSEEIERLRDASHAVDRIAGRLRAGQISLVGQTESAVSAELGRQILEEGHGKVNFAIVAAGANASSPHHHPGDRVIQEGEVVLCDFGGTMFGDDGVGYCSDLTRCVYTGDPPAEFAELYDVLFQAQAASVRAATVGTSAEDVDRVGRQIIADAGYGEFFIHRTGHGIGIEGHEEPYIVEGNSKGLEAGNAFSIEPGIYVPGKWGARIEDIVVSTAEGPDPLNLVDHDLAIIA